MWKSAYVGVYQLLTSIIFKQCKLHATLLLPWKFICHLTCINKTGEVESIQVALAWNCMVYTWGKEKTGRITHTHRHMKMTVSQQFPNPRTKFFLL